MFEFLTKKNPPILFGGVSKEKWRFIFFYAIEVLSSRAVVLPETSLEMDSTANII